MAQIRRFPLFHHLRSDPNQYILHHRKGKVVREGPGLAYWFSPLSAAIAQVPTENIETTFVLNERSADLQDLAVQCSLVYRCAEPRKVAARFNFTISATGSWIEKPLQKLNSLWSQRAQSPVRSYLTHTELVDALREGPDRMATAIREALATDAELGELGLALVNVQIQSLSPEPDLERALQTPTRESIQQRADEASFQRRALAVEKERAIKENELATEIELARRQEDLIARQGANAMREAEQESATARLRVEAQAEREGIQAAAEARSAEVKAQGQAEARRLLAAAENDAEKARVAIWTEAPNRTVFGLAAQELARNLPSIEHLNVTPDLVSEALGKLLRETLDER